VAAEEPLPVWVALEARIRKLVALALLSLLRQVAVVVADGLAEAVVGAEAQLLHQVLQMELTDPMARLTSDMAEQQVAEQVVPQVMVVVLRELQALHLLVEQEEQEQRHQVAVVVAATSVVVAVVAITIVQEVMVPVAVAVLIFTTLPASQASPDLLLHKVVTEA
jgi:hypothetical protein